MKLKYIIPSFVALLATLVVGCSEDDDKTYLDGLRVSQSYVSIDANGGAKTITINADGDWTFDFDVEFATDSIDEVKGKVNYNQKVSQLSLKNDNEDNTWFTVTPTNGQAGTTEIKFEAPAATDDHVSTIKIKIGDSYQTIVVSQKASSTELPVSTVKEVLAGSDGKTYRVKGSVAAITNTIYGNWIMADDEGNQLTIYGTLDKNGSTKSNPLDNTSNGWNIELGDEVTVEGPRSTYGSTIELVDASVVKVKKALIQCKESAKTIEMTGDPFKLTLVNKGEGLTFSTKSDWLEFNPNGYTINSKGEYEFTIVPSPNNTGAIRVDTLAFESSNAQGKTRLLIPITQLATSVEQNVSIYSLAQKLTASSNKNNPVPFYVEIKDAIVTYKSGSNIFIEDEVGGLLIYNGSLSLKAGDKINGKVWGSGYMYNGLPEATVFNYELAKVESGNEVKATKVSLAELAANYDDYVSRFVRIEDVTVDSAINVNYYKVVSGGRVTDGTNQLLPSPQSTGTYKKKNQTKDDKGTKIYFYWQADVNSKVSFNCIPSINKERKPLNIYEASWTK